ncbi:unnamed protein product [Owenia fusiformis]|uniref:Annexin n=1 Tax=Owenia fusiformis TaxID=6347 RepID=A0A8S4N4F2_OWEFU|nr:unnamed protein product [Owenia fusiformis]
MAMYCEGTIKPNNFEIKDADKHYEGIVGKLKKAFVGLGTDERRVIEILTTHSNAQRQEIIKQFKAQTGKDLEEEVKAELGGLFETLVLALLVPSSNFDAKCIHDAMKFGTCEKTLIQVLCSKTNSEIKAIADAYEAMYDCEMEEDLKSDLSGTFQNIIISIIQGKRADNIEVDQELVVKDAEEIYQAGEANENGTDEYKFNKVLSLRSRAHMNAVFDQYKKIAGKEIEQTLDYEAQLIAQPDTRDAFKAICAYARNPLTYFATCLHESLAGIGTDDSALIRLIVDHSEVDLADIKKRYRELFNSTLVVDVQNDTSGDYKKLLTAIIGTD